MELQYYFSNDFYPFESYFLEIQHRVRKYQANEPISAIGEPMNEMFYIKNGTISSCLLHESGNIKSFAFYGKGYLAPLYFPGEMDTLDSVGFTAVSELEVFVFERRNFEQYLEKNPELNKAMYEAYIKLVSLLLQENINQLFCSGLEKICNFFYIYLENMEGQEDAIYLTQSDIAQHVGLNRVNVAKNLRKLREKEVIETHRNRIDILNMEKLGAFCSKEVQVILKK